MPKLPTETVLKDWRHGNTQAERLCAQILHIEMYEAVDPQCPLGGPDGLKDILCEKNGEKWVVACYFPTTDSGYSNVEKKFIHDLEGVSKNNADGLTFFTNQKLTPGERAKLAELANPLRSEIYHLERIRSLLDSPKGYGIRLEYLNIPMVEEEQFSLWSTLGDKLTAKFISQERELVSLSKKVDMLMCRTIAIQQNLTKNPSSLSLDQNANSDIAHFPTSTLSVGELLWLHRLLTDDLSARGLPHSQVGVFRSVNVWIGGPTPSEARFVPVPPKEIQLRINTLLEEWRAIYPNLIHAERNTIINALAKFHHDFLSIHPFLDANGRVGRAILQQQALELLSKHISAIFSDDPKFYYDCMKKADEGDLNPLAILISSCLE